MGVIGKRKRERIMSIVNENFFELCHVETEYEELGARVRVM